MYMITSAKSVPNCFFLTLMCKIIEMYMLMREKMWGNSVGNSWEIFKFVVI